MQFDRRWLERVLSLIAGVRVAGLAVTVVLLLGAAFTVTAVVRLSLHARRDELDIMQLVGAHLFRPRPLRHRGVAARGHRRAAGHPRLAAAFGAVQEWLGADRAGLLGGQAVSFLTWRIWHAYRGRACGRGDGGLVASRAAR